MWQFAEAVRGLADGCRELGTPVTGGNVSFYNQTGSTPILPTPVIGVLGVIDDVTRRVRQGFATDGAQIYLLGETRDEFGGSEWMHVVHGYLGGLPPAVDLAREKVLADVLIACARDGVLDSAHDLSEGGLAHALVESIVHGHAGVRIELPQNLDPFVALFSESTGRAIVTVTRANGARLTELCRARGLPAVRIGAADVLENTLDVQGQFRIPVRELRAAWGEPLPTHLG
jgi:phosphoribosylformylglycinamidine synthase